MEGAPWVDKNKVAWPYSFIFFLFYWEPTMATSLPVCHMPAQPGWISGPQNLAWWDTSTEENDPRRTLVQPHYAVSAQLHAVRGVSGTYSVPIPPQGHSVFLHQHIARRSIALTTWVACDEECASRKEEEWSTGRWSGLSPGRLIGWPGLAEGQSALTGQGVGDAGARCWGSGGCEKAMEICQRGSRAPEIQSCSPTRPFGRVDMSHFALYDLSLTATHTTIS